MLSICCNLTLNINSINKHHQRISKIKLFIDNYNWNDINFPAAKKDWNKFEVNNKNIALNILSPINLNII